MPSVFVKPKTQVSIMAIESRLKYSIIVPVFNRPDEVEELLESLCRQTEKDFEVIIVEDGSTIDCGNVCLRYMSKLDLRYYQKELRSRSEPQLRCGACCRALSHHP